MSDLPRVAWTYEGREVEFGHPDALADYPTPEFVDRAALLLAEDCFLDGMPTDEQLRWALGVFAVTEGVTRRGEDPGSPQVQDRLLRYEEMWESRYEAVWPERFHETREQRKERRDCVAAWRAGEGDGLHE